MIDRRGFIGTLGALAAGRLRGEEGSPEFDWALEEYKREERIRQERIRNSGKPYVIIHQKGPPQYVTIQLPLNPADMLVGLGRQT